MLANVVGKSPQELALFTQQKGFIPFLAGHLTVYGLAFVIPLFLVLAANIVGLVFYLKKTNKPEKISAKDLTDEEKEALKKELLKELQEK